MTRLIRILPLLLLLTVSVHARAQTNPERAAELGSEAASFFRQGEYEAAADRFLEAYNLDPHPVLLFNLGRALQELGQLPAARDTFLDAIAIADDPGVQTAAQQRLDEVLAALRSQGYDPNRVTPSEYVQRGTLLVTSLPEGAVLFLGNERVGTTPVTLDPLDIGSHEVRLVLEGYHPVSATIEFRGGQDRLRHFTLEERTSLETYVPPQPGYLSVISATAGIAVLVDGMPIGQTPVSNHGLAPGQYVVTLRSPDFAPFTTTVSILSTEETRIIATPQRVAGRDFVPGQTHRRAGGILMGIGAAALVTGGVFGIMALDSASTYRAELDNPDRGIFRDQARTRALVSDISMGVGAGVLVAGAIVYLIAPRETRNPLDFLDRDGLVLAPALSPFHVGLDFSIKF
jgi:hypothetical protein